MGGAFADVERTPHEVVTRVALRTWMPREDDSPSDHVALR